MLYVAFSALTDSWVSERASGSLKKLAHLSPNALPNLAQPELTPEKKIS